MPRAWEAHFDENRSLWLADKPPYQPSPPLRSKLSFDVAIVGGGFTGVSAAYHLSERYPDMGIAVLEARVLANGASGRNGGQMLNGVHGFESGDPHASRRVYEATREGIDTIERLVSRHRLRVPYRRDGHLDVCTTARSADAAAAEVERLRDAGLPLRYLDRRALRELVALDNAEGAVLDPEGGELDGVALIRQLKPVLEQRGVAFFEGTPVVRVVEGRTCTLETPSGRVQAASVVLATNAYTPHLGYFRTRLVPLHSHVLGSEPLSRGRWSRLGWRKTSGFTDDRGRLSYGTLTSSGRLLFGGGSNAAYDYRFGNGTALTGTPARAVEAVRNVLLSYLPSLTEMRIEHRWSGPIALTMDRIGTMGVRGEHRNVYFALGYSGHGVTLANLAGKVLADLYAGSDEKWRGLPFYRRPLRFVPPEPLRWSGYHLYTKLTGRSPRSAASA